MHYEPTHSYTNKFGDIVSDPRFRISEVEHPNLLPVLSKLKQYGNKGSVNPTTLDRFISGSDDMVKMGPRNYYVMSLKLADFYTTYGDIVGFQKQWAVKSALANNGVPLVLNILGVPGTGLPTPIIEVQEYVTTLPDCTIHDVTIEGSGVPILKFTEDTKTIFATLGFAWNKETHTDIGSGTAENTIKALIHLWNSSATLRKVKVYIGPPK